jgi:toxin ParE1/3/4
VIWSRRAREDLAAIFRFIGRDSRTAAEDWVARLVARAESAGELPLAGRVVPEIGHRDIRERIERAYRIIYRVDGQDVRILTVIEGHRLLDPETLGMDPCVAGIPAARG